MCFNLIFPEDLTHSTALNGFAVCCRSGYTTEGLILIQYLVSAITPGHFRNDQLEGTVLKSFQLLTFTLELQLMISLIWERGGTLDLFVFWVGGSIPWLISL